MDYRIGDIVTGRITGIQPYGAFVALDDEEQGLIHISECQHGFVKGIHELFHLGQNVQVVILDIDEYSHRISLSIRALQAPPALSPRRRRKHYWTTRKLHTGFAPIAARLPGWVTDYTQHDETERS
ncbi:CvfD/Ygs/GSP13 family RNA-binding post-transcriptional regulator [Lacticaseibacillus songhuajiangensis]|jgi:general stress protein 13|uniref:CvfD/Ygs/GSP13 family RNA-binding post-transcriptional regulator n=1 Tax=Lacticaseibacillus songhuajiangensis TaxID=1296539 RepID=UPI000F78A482|nr:CvfD/Ygs/GSP13 family RNA-binding post-transcriptional regulator [Lacticaseibacillus songhuajiangensis]MCI1283368.1 CvfD/Ygs/GSP13 family RNA-binding post-transcriptional regulator [Lacticaseibacillus songhuajiangensis]